MWDKILESMYDDKIKLYSYLNSPEPYKYAIYFFSALMIFVILISIHEHFNQEDF